METYKIWDKETHTFLPQSYKTRKKAARTADQKNFQYGATRYFARFA